MKTVTFYHSLVCPRCHMANMMLSGLLRDYPDVQLEKVEYLANMRQSRRQGVRGIPTLVHGDKQLGGFLLTKGSIRQFLDSL